jgi:hypothetical protein
VTAASLAGAATVPVPGAGAVTTTVVVVGAAGAGVVALLGVLATAALAPAPATGAAVVGLLVELPRPSSRNADSIACTNLFCRSAGRGDWSSLADAGAAGGVHRGATAGAALGVAKELTNVKLNEVMDMAKPFRWTPERGAGSMSRLSAAVGPAFTPLV